MKRRDFFSTTMASFPLLLPGLKTTTASFASVKEESIIINSGIGGNNTVDLLARIEKDCLSYKPDLTVLMIGTNDMNSRKYVPLNDYRRNLEKIISMIVKSKSKIVLMNLLPVYEPYLYTRHATEFYLPEGHSGRLREMNELIAATARKFKLAFLDIHHIFKTVGNVGLAPSSLIKNEANSHTTDGLHPTGEGYRVIAVALSQKIVDSRLPCGKIVCFGDSITFGDGSPNGQNYPAYLRKLLS